MADPIASRIVAVFNGCFARSHRTVMRGGGDEPLYLPGDDVSCAQVIFNRDYPASALHEAAHWCIAATGRRRLVDYGYRYMPPPRTPRERQMFLDAEVTNQGLECLFTHAVGIPFKASMDDLTCSAKQRGDFDREVRRSAQAWLDRGLGTRAARLRKALETEFRNG